MEAAGRKRIPKFAWDYMSGGIGRETVLRENISSLDRVKLNPRYLTAEADQPDTQQAILDQTFDYPFGVAPIGLSGIVWPRAAEHLASAAKAHGLPFTLSGFATSSIEQIGEIGGRLWFQHYLTVDDSINRDMLKRAQKAGFEVLVVTVDIPTATRRDRDIYNGLSVPPQFNLRTLADIIAHPRWALAMLNQGIPEFLNIKPYLPPGASLAETSEMMSALIECHVSTEILKQLRDLWPGKMIVKGILDIDEARLCQQVGIDAISVSNHGGRQLDAAPTALEVLPRIRETLGKDYPILVDGGVRCGLDIARYIASGADFVLLGRAFMFALAALGDVGASHAMHILKKEFKMTLGQIGCARVADLPRHLYSSNNDTDLRCQ